jgi:hypothetical protein
MPFVVIYDASVLCPSTVRDLLIRVAQAGLVQARWTDEILDEMFHALTRDRAELDKAKLDKAKLARTRALMGTAVRDSLKLPDPDDRHVLAAAIPAGHR